jgi:hypothetical protein
MDSPVVLSAPENLYILGFSSQNRQTRKFEKWSMVPYPGKTRVHGTMEPGLLGTKVMLPPYSASQKTYIYHFLAILVAP